MPGYWLMKSEPDTFGIDDLVRVGVEPWTGVRNYTARNFMRDQMKVDDLALFYHSSVDPPGVVGIARIARTGVVDETQFDPASPYYDPGSKRDAPRWICVDVAFVEKLPRQVALDELRANPALAGMLVLQRGMRLCVQPVSPAHYKAIVAMAKKPAPAAKAPAAKPAAKAPAKPAAKVRTAGKGPDRDRAPRSRGPARPKARAR